MIREWTTNRARGQGRTQSPRRPLAVGSAGALWPLLLISLLLSACGGGGSSSSSQSERIGALAGNWQFTLTGPADNSFTGGIQGGFFVQDNNNNTVTGAVTYAIFLPQPPPTPPTLCSSGTAPVTGTVEGPKVKLTAVAGDETFTLTGKVAGDGSIMSGTYDSTNGKGCGTAQAGLAWTATSVRALSGNVVGSIHSQAAGLLGHQAFSVTGFLTQGQNIGASSATITGTLDFQGYSCLTTASVNGVISGNSVILQVFDGNGLNVGQIGAPPNFPSISPVVFDNSTPGGGYLLHGTNGYGFTTQTCPSAGAPADVGDICLALVKSLKDQNGNPTVAGCTAPILLSPASLTFPARGVGSFPSTQTVTLTNNDPAGEPLELSIRLATTPGISGQSDFSNIANFTEQDTCSDGQPNFTLQPQQSCTISVSFSPQQGCPWIPFGNPPSQSGAAPSKCPFTLNAKLFITSSKSADQDTQFAVPITGKGLSALAPSTPELDFGAEAVGESSEPQVLSFTNQGLLPVQILPALNQPCGQPNTFTVLPRPLVPGSVSGFQVVTGLITTDVGTIDFVCDVDLTSLLPNFQISADSCSGQVLGPEGSCSIAVSFVPQPHTSLNPALDYFLELDTLQCTSNVTTDCEIDSGRFPVELRANQPSSLRMTPGAGLDFGNVPIGQASDPPLKILLFNDPADPNAGPVNFTGNLVVGDYFETDDCGASLAPGGSCTLTVTFTPKVTGSDPGTITITYAVGQTQTIYLRGTGTKH